MKKSAFTLIELLVVIAIIAILAGIALPVFNKVLEKGHVTQDASNMRQLGIGTVAYLNDNNDTIFSNTTQVQNTAGGSATLYAPGLLQVNYVPNVNVFQSPFDKRTSTTNPANVSYGINSNLATRSGSGSGTGFDGNFANIASSSQLILYAPAFTEQSPPQSNLAASDWKGLDNACVQVSPPSGSGGGGGVSPSQGTHQNGRWINVLYADSHVASIKCNDFKTTTDMSTSGGVNGKLEWLPLGQ